MDETTTRNNDPAGEAAGRAADAASKAYRTDTGADDPKAADDAERAPVGHGIEIDDETWRMLGDVIDRLGAAAGAIVIAFHLRDESTLVRVGGLSSDPKLKTSVLLTIGAELARGTEHTSKGSSS